MKEAVLSFQDFHEDQAGLMLWQRRRFMSLTALHLTVMCLT